MSKGPMIPFSHGGSVGNLLGSQQGMRRGTSENGPYTICSVC